MTKLRIIGQDTPFMDWIRNHPDLPSTGDDFGFTQTDCDTIIHVRKNPKDSLGVREIEAVMLMEIKTHGGVPDYAQRSTLFAFHSFRGVRYVNKKGVDVPTWHFGVGIISVNGTRPDDSSYMRWGRFRKSADDIYWTPIDIPTFVKMLRLEVHPDARNKQFTPLKFRRHHKTQDVHTYDRAELGFLYEKRLRLQS